MAERILLVEDDELIGEMIKLNLEREGYRASWVMAGDKALPAIENEAFDAVVLDVMLPGKNGFEVVSELRAKEIFTPVLMLTARSETQAKVQGLDSGADDYLTKPFDMAEFLARVRAMIRRGQAQREVPSNQVVKIGRFTANLDTREAQTVEGQVRLSEKEARLLGMFVRMAGHSLKRVDILEEVWGMDTAPTERTVDNFVLRLRKLFEEEPERPRHFLTVRAVGYRFEM